MKTTYLILLFSSITYAQVGINTANPQTTLHIDGGIDNPNTGVPTTAEQANDLTVTAAGNLGLGTTTPTEKIDIYSGNARIRNINSNIGVGGTDRPVVADANGVLKTIGFANYTLFHARLANDQVLASNNTINTLIFAAPLVSSPYYSYDASTGYLTFVEAGNYLISLQASFGNTAAGGHTLIGIRPVPDADYLGRGSSYLPTATSGSVGQLMNYNTVLVIPRANYQIRFTASFGSSTASTVLATETGSTGSGNVTNVTIQKI